MRRIAFASLFVVFLIPLALRSQEPLTNDSVVKLVKAGLSEEVVLGMIKLQPAKYALGPDDIISLKKEGVSDKVIAAMVERAHGGGAKAAEPAAKAGPGVDIPEDAGVYLRKDGKLADVDPEIVNWRTGGMLKAIATSGLAGSHVNGWVKGSHSRLQLSAPLEFVIRCPEGTSVAEYRLLRLDEKSDRREFRAARMSALGASSGTERKNEVAFDSEKIASRVFKIKLGELKKGEYGFLPPGAMASSSAAASLGKMYTFGIE